MSAVLFRQHGGPEVLEWAEVDRPEPRRDQVLVRVEACGINHLDLWTRRGLPGREIPLPHILGNEPVGVVEALGPDAGADWPANRSPLAEGQRVLVAPGYLDRFHADRSGWDALLPDYRVIGHQSPGGYGQYVVARAENLVPVSDRLAPHEWAATPLTFLTAWHMLMGRARVKAGETVLVMAGGSGVGTAAIQIARWAGCRVFATAGSETKLARSRELGAEEAFDHAAVLPWEKEVRRASGGGVDVVVEHVGEAVFSRAVTALRSGGRIVTCGATTGPAAKLNLTHLFAKQLSLLGSYMGDFTELLEVVAHLEAGHFRPVVDRTLPVREAAEAHRLLEERQVFGKLVLTHE